MFFCTFCLSFCYMFFCLFLMLSFSLFFFSLSLHFLSKDKILPIENYIIIIKEQLYEENYNHFWQVVCLLRHLLPFQLCECGEVLNKWMERY